MIYGPNVDVLLPLDDEQIIDSGAGWFRAPLRLDAPGPATVERLVGKGLQFMGVVDRTTGRNPAPYRSAYNGLVAAIQVTNEWEHLGPSSMGYMSHAEVLAWRAPWADFAPILVMGAMADGRPEVLTPAFAAAWRYSAFHTYGRRPLRDWPNQWGFGFLGDLADGYAIAAPGAEFIVSEFGATVTEIQPTARPRFYAESLRTMIRHPAIKGAFPFGLNNGGGGGANAYRLGQAELDAMRTVLEEELANIPKLPTSMGGSVSKLDELIAKYGTWPAGDPSKDVKTQRRVILNTPEWVEAVEDEHGQLFLRRGLDITQLPNP